jgi:hypothetical protein
MADEHIVRTKKVRDDLSEILRQQPDIGVLKIEANWLLERPNRFDPRPRMKLKAEVFTALSYLILMAVVFAVANLR